jgi:hypothetical protein
MSLCFRTVACSGEGVLSSGKILAAVKVSRPVGAEAMVSTRGHPRPG